MQPRDPSRDVGAPATASLGPVRTCVGCRGRGSRSVLVRVVQVDGRAVVDQHRSMPGRGAWLHPDPDCLALAVKRRALVRALRATELDVSGLAVG
ncbi:YlxR family protein [Demequina iriomotensis]|uniref:YlxR family protein n=1 Tax=Demequina iriomotensis TaxID=1536641 RepID=UPI0012E068DA